MTINFPVLVRSGLLLVAIVTSVPAQSNTDQSRDPLGVRAVIDELDRMAAKRLWPRFDPRAYPVAIFDGKQTWLFRHPRPPREFTAVAGDSGVWRVEGRHAAVTSNSSADINGLATATVLRGSRDRSAASRASVAAHETFHLFQRAHHPGWTANEATLFVYPVDDAAGLMLRRLETRALERALAAASDDRRACWARAAMDARRERFGLLSRDDITYERVSELNEGLANYVQAMALGERPMPAAEEFAPDEVRARTYVTGAAMGFLLDRMAPGWKEIVDAADTVALDPLLARAIPASVTPCALGEDESRRIRDGAERDVGRLAARRDSTHKAFTARDGWRLVVEMGREPLFPQGFDPLNVTRLTRDDVLHARFVQLGNSAGSVEVFARPSVTTAAGAHPLLNGVRTVTVTGLAADPVTELPGGGVAIQGEGVKGRFSAATVVREAKVVRVRLR